MTDRERKMIDGYLPHERDPELEPLEYYVKDQRDRVHKVFIGDILPGDMNSDDAEYGVYEIGSKRRIDAGYGTPYRGFTRGYLYDNKQDCKDGTHDWFSGWEHLREVQKNG